MTMAEQMKNSFTRVTTEHMNEQGFRRLVSEDEDLAPGFMPMIEYYQRKVKVLVRRGYRFYAGSALPTDSDILLEHTKPQMRTPLVRVALSGFADGVLVGHKDEQIVKMALFFGAVNTLFEDADFRSMSENMVTGYLEDPGVMAFIGDFFDQGLDTLRHVTGFAHQEVEPVKVWDVWLAIGQAATGTAYLAGQLLGMDWAERDVLDGIELVSEGVNDEPPGEGNENG